MAATGLLEGFLSAGVTGFAALLLLVALAAWRRVGGAKLAALAGAFALLAAKGLLAALAALGLASLPGLEPSLPVLALDFAVLLLLYVGTVR